VRRAAKEGRTLLNETDSKKLLSTYDITATIPRLARNSDEAASVADSVGYPVVMKIASDDISHKSDIGGVRLGLQSADEVKQLSRP